MWIPDINTLLPIRVSILVCFLLKTSSVREMHLIVWNQSCDAGKAQSIDAKVKMIDNSPQMHQHQNKQACCENGSSRKSKMLSKLRERKLLNTQLKQFPPLVIKQTEKCEIWLQPVTCRTESQHAESGQNYSELHYECGCWRTEALLTLSETLMSRRASPHHIQEIMSVNSSKLQTSFIACQRAARIHWCMGVTSKSHEVPWYY